MSDDPEIRELGPRVLLEFEVVTEQSFPWGLCCSNCGRTIDVGQPLISHATGVGEDGAVGSVTTCVYCPAPTGGEA